jgi:hypothetical protein
MDMNNYVLEVVVRDRLAEMRARGEQSARVRAAGPEPRPLRFVLGQALIHLGWRLHGAARSSGMTIETIESESRKATHGAVHG